MLIYGNTEQGRAPTAAELADAQAIAETIKGDYLAVRVLPDASVAALAELFFTRAIVMDCDRAGWARRYCFDDRDRAVIEFVLLRSSDDAPAGYIDSR